MHRTALVLLALLVLSGHAHAADCAGGSVRSLRVAPGRVAFAGSVTQAGLTHIAAAAGGLTITLADADDGTTVYTLAVPAERFVTRGRATKYDRQGPFAGTIRLADVRGQADTVLVELRDPRPTTGGTLDDRPLRAHVTIGDRCARTCVAACSTKAGTLRCRPSRDYVPFADAGFGARHSGGGRRATSAYCGLTIDTTQACDFLIDERCVLPFPSSAFLIDDPTTPTGKRIHYGPTALPRNTSGKHIDPTDWNTLDGFSPGAVILALFPDTGFPVDPSASGAPLWTSYPRALAPDSPTVLLRADTGERVLHFAEMDANTADVTRKALIVRPGVRLDDGTRYLVAFRNLVDTRDTAIRPRLAFRALRDGAGDAELAESCGQRCAGAIAGRRAGFEDVFARLAAAGVTRSDLVLAWDFTTASAAALTDWIVAVRDQAFALGTPSFTVTGVDDGPGGVGRNANIFRRVQGTFQAPLFMTADAPGSRLNLVDGVPRQNGWATVPFVVDIPHVAVNAGGTPRPARPTTWGHGLLGSRTQLTALSELAQLFNFVITAVDMQGMSSADVPAILPLVADFSLFHRIPERLHQGFLNHLLLGRLMGDPVLGFNSHPDFQFGDPPVGIFDTTEVYYSGGSQGGIFGAAIMSIAEDFKRGFLAVPGSNYSTLLHRSIDFDPFLAIIRSAYPDPLDEQINVAVTQQQWDRAEPHGYLNHLKSGDLSEPPVPHKVLLHMATYDSEVSNVATEIMLRSLGIAQVTPVHRSFFQVPERPAPFDDSAFVEVDPQLGFSRCNVPGGANPGAMCNTNADCPGAGDPPTRTRCDAGVPPFGNQPPTFNNRAHGSTGTFATAQQLDAFLRPDGRVEQFCVGTCDPD